MFHERSYYWWPRVRLRNVHKFFRYTYYNCYYGIRNLIKWTPIIWGTRTWDWTYLVEIMELQLRDMANCTEKYGIHLHKDRSIRQMRICVHLLHRLQREEYFDEPLKRFNNPRHAYEHSEAVAKQDLHLLFNVMEKHLREWWD